MKRKLESWGVVITWKYEDGSWNTETLNDTDMPDSVTGSVHDHLEDYQNFLNKNILMEKKQ